MQKALDPKAPIVLDSRLGFLCQPEAFSIFLDVDIQEAARRIMHAGRGADETQYNTLEEAIAATQSRDNAMQKRYLKLYNIDYFDHKHYDLVIDTSDKTPDQILEIILDAYAKHKEQIA